MIPIFMKPQQDIENWMCAPPVRRKNFRPATAKVLAIVEATAVMKAAMLR